MAQKKYNNIIEQVWEKAPYCNCNSQDCHINSHRLCSVCYESILYGSHESIESQRNSISAWNTDHIVPKSKGVNNKLDNLQATHIYCNREKSNK